MPSHAGAQDGGWGLCPAWTPQTPKHGAWPSMGGFSRSPLAEDSILASLEAARKAIWGSLTQEGGGEENPQPDANTPEAAACSQACSEQHPGCCTREPTGLPHRPCLALRMALIVSSGPVGTRPTRAGWALRNGVSGPWPQVGTGLEDRPSHLTALRVSSLASPAALGSAGYALGTPKP